MKIAIIKDDKLDYCHSAPFHPSVSYPEYPFQDTGTKNECYDRVRELFYRLGMDIDNYGRPDWNPLGTIIRPGDNVFIKPNLVSHFKPKGGEEALVTQGSVIRAVLDYANIALRGTGTLTIGDAPYINTDFSKVVQDTSLNEIAEYYAQNAGIKLKILDLRLEKGELRSGRIKKRHLEGDPRGYAFVDLKHDSEHSRAGDYEKLRIAYYDRHQMAEHHNSGKNEYLIANSILEADVILNVPKLKTHSKTAFSCALKNMVGINGCKDMVPHHKAGSIADGGDEYLHKDPLIDLSSRIKDEIPTTANLYKIYLLRGIYSLLFISRLLQPAKNMYHVGSWYGNETLPRTITDLNKIIFYADRSGVMCDTPQRRIFTVVDGIVAGEREGPMENQAKKCGVLVAGYNPVDVDIVCSMIMGFDHNKIPMIKYALHPIKYPLTQGDASDIEVLSEKCNLFPLVYTAYNCHIEPPSGWKGHIEYEDQMGAKYGRSEAGADTRPINI
ncbi:conserved hypothetical protein [Methanocella paludicola SANAE]|uniref:DUF362 domain-containing protein n=1 Tax=Methanocella paludicola (strain DSM 17711 / JCM 13418 / NBRC 101707 / SANAE) TaxID=304371 RepID=D1YWN4_METPS|nr:DUF362 domain-containing protein [Methanocella paludicola]BAI60856.1 conserved hypothetical protein [Methanocella paludicola SANAE]